MPKHVFDNLPALIADPLFIIPHKEGGLRMFVEAATVRGEPIAVGVSIDSSGRIQTITPLHDSDEQTGQERMNQAVASAKGRIYARNKEALEHVRASAEAPPGTIPLQRNSNSGASLLTRDGVVKGIQSERYGRNIAFSRATPQPTPAATWQAPSLEDAKHRTAWDNIAYTLQDKMVDVKRVEHAIRETGQQIADDQDVYLQEELYHARVSHKSQEFVQKELRIYP